MNVAKRYCLFDCANRSKFVCSVNVASVTACLTVQTEANLYVLGMFAKVDDWLFELKLL